MTNARGSIEVPYGWVIVTASLLIHTIGLGVPNVLFVALKPIAADFDWPRAVPSMAYSLMMIGTGIGGVFMGWWMDKRGVMSPVMFGSVMIGLGALVASRSDGMWSLYVANGLLMGLLGKAAMIAPLAANVTRWFDRRRGLAVAIIASGQGFAGAIWPPVFDALNTSVGWRDTYFYFGLFAIASMVPLSLLLRPQPPIPPAHARPGGHSDDGRVLGLPPNGVQAILWIAVIGCCTAMAMPIVHLVSHATDLGVSPMHAAQMLSLLFGAAFFSRIGFGVLADRIGGVRTLIIASVCQAIMLLVFATVEGVAALYVAALLFGLGFSGIMPCYALIVRLLFPAGEAGWRIATIYTFAAAGMALGGWLGGAIYDLTGTYRWAFLTGFGFNVMNLALIGMVWLRQVRFGVAPLPVHS
jgi:MFS family permease